MNLYSESKFPDFQTRYLFNVNEKITPQIFADIKLKITDWEFRKIIKNIAYENIVFKNPTAMNLSFSIIYDKLSMVY
jgi:hypothetical protein